MNFSLLIKLLILALCAWLWQKGGQKEGRIRDIPTPIILAAFFAIYLKTWWLFLACGAGLQLIRTGYGNYSPEDDDKPCLLARILKDRKGWYIRATWGLIVAVGAGLGLYLGHFIGIWAYLGYIGLNVLINYSISRLKLAVLPTDILIALGVASIIFFI